MLNNVLPKLPDGARYGAEFTEQLPVGGGDYFAPDGCVIKSINTETGVVICVPLLYLDQASGHWIAIKSV